MIRGRGFEKQVRTPRVVRPTPHPASRVFSREAACSTFRGNASDHCPFVDEFELIARCFRDRTTRRPGTVLGIGDDAGLLDTDGAPLVHAWATVGFSAQDDAAGIARRVFAAAFLRLAAQAVLPRWATLALTLETGEPAWTDPFSAAVAAVCNACAVELIGGDTSRGPGRATVFALGTGITLPRRTASGPPAAAVEARWPLRPAGTSEQAIAELVSVCVSLAARGARIRCDDSPVRGDDPRPDLLELVAYADAAGMDALRVAAGHLRTNA